MSNVNILSLKLVAWDAEKKQICSPQRTDFIWPKKGIIWSQCDKCSGGISKDCTCGIYSSPNLEALDYYKQWKNCVTVLINVWGNGEIWTGPVDQPWTYIVRSQGAQIVQVVSDTLEIGGDMGHRFFAMVSVADYLGLEILEYHFVKDLIKRTWLQNVQIDPYGKEIK